MTASVPTTGGRPSCRSSSTSTARPAPPPRTSPTRASRPSSTPTAVVAKAHPGLEVDRGRRRVDRTTRSTTTVGEDFQRAETLSLPITLVILLLTFGALFAAGVPLLLALSAVGTAIGLAALVSHVFPVSDTLNSVILLIGMAVGVDYSLFYVRRSPRGARPRRQPP